MLIKKLIELINKENPLSKFDQKFGQKSKPMRLAQNQKILSFSNQSYCAVVFILLALIRIPHRIKLSQFLIELRDMYVKTNTYLRYTYKWCPIIHIGTLENCDTQNLMRNQSPGGLAR